MKPERNTLLVMFIIAVLLTLLFLVNQWGRPGDYEPASPIEKNDTMGEKNVSVEEINSSNEPGQGAFLDPASKNVCEGCHMSGKSSVPQVLTALPHQNGGAYCLTCHEIDHEKHPMSNGVNCDSCHAGQQKPVYSNGSISCNECHNYPDALSPSGGNIITIHRPRDISCSKCHMDDCKKCHAEIGSSARWEKRLRHFKVVARRR